VDTKRNIGDIIVNVLYYDKMASVRKDSTIGSNTSSNDPKMLDSRVFIGNLPSEKVNRKMIEEMFSEYGKILGVSLHKSYGFVQYESEEDAKKAVEATHRKLLEGSTLGEKF